MDKVNLFSCVKNVAQHFVVVEVVFDTLDFLVIFVSFPSNKNNISFFCQSASRFDGFFPVDYGDDVLFLFFVESCHHIVYDVLWIFEARVVAGDDDGVAGVDSLLGHYWAFPFIAVPARTAYGNHLTSVSKHLFYSVEHIDQSVGCMGVVNDGGESFRRTKRFETAVNRT